MLHKYIGMNIALPDNMKYNDSLHSKSSHIGSHNYWSLQKTMLQERTNIHSKIALYNQLGNGNTVITPCLIHNGKNDSDKGWWESNSFSIISLNFFQWYFQFCFNIIFNFISILFSISFQYYFQFYFNIVFFGISTYFRHLWRILHTVMDVQCW